MPRLNMPRLDVVALIMLVPLPFAGVFTMGEALAGFSGSNIALIAALFVIGEGLVRTGIARRLGDWMIAKAGRSEIRLIVLLMVVACERHKRCDFERQPGGPDGNALG